jgi:hypothetical protein
MSQDTLNKLQIIGELLARKRDEAIADRKASGIESVWKKCEESYLGIDDANRGEEGAMQWIKPTTSDGSLITSQTKGNDGKSTVFVRLTSRYVDAGAAKLSEILFPVDGKPFSIDPTPISDLSKKLEDKRIVPHALTGKPLMRKPTDEQIKDGEPNQVRPTTYADLAKDTQAEAQKAANAAEMRIYDWLVECNYDKEARKVVFDAARLGTGILKSPIPSIQKSRSISKKDNVVKLEFVEKIVPIAKWVDVWNFFPDPSCGEDIHNGSYTFERDLLSPRSLNDLIGQEGYLESQIVKVIKEGAGKCLVNNSSSTDKKKQFEVWYYYGEMSREELEPAYASGELPEGQDRFYVLATMVNDSVIKAVLNPMKSGMFPYQVMTWSRRANSWTGVGVAEQADMPQVTLNAATRSLLNNAGLSSGVQIVIDPTAITPANHQWKIEPNKIWLKTDDANQRSVSDLFAVMPFPNIGAQLMDIITYAFKLAEESTSIPLITQGQTGATTPETLGAVQLQNNNAATLLRSVGYKFDDNVTEPMINAFYEWLLLDPDVPDEEKGDFKIMAKGSSAMVERAINEITLSGMAQMVLNPAFGVDPEKWFAEWMVAKRLDPSKIQYTKEEKEKMASQEQPPPLPIQIAQMKIEADAQKEQFKAQSSMQEIQAKAQVDLQTMQQEQALEQQMLADGSAPHIQQAKARIAQEQIKAEGNQSVQASRANTEQVRAQMEYEIARQNGEFRVQQLQIEKELKMLEYSQRNNLTLEQTKAQLAQTAMKEQTRMKIAQQEVELAVRESDKNRLAGIHKDTPSLIRDEMNNEYTP